jgi:hypothetical protein
LGSLFLPTPGPCPPSPALCALTSPRPPTPNPAPLRAWPRAASRLAPRRFALGPAPLRAWPRAASAHRPIRQTRKAIDIPGCCSGGYYRTCLFCGTFSECARGSLFGAPASSLCTSILLSVKNPRANQRQNLFDAGPILVWFSTLIQDADQRNVPVAASLRKAHGQ